MFRNVVIPTLQMTIIMQGMVACINMFLFGWHVVLLSLSICSISCHVTQQWLWEIFCFCPIIVNYARTQLISQPLIIIMHWHRHSSDTDTDTAHITTTHNHNAVNTAANNGEERMEHKPHKFGYYVVISIKESDSVNVQHSTFHIKGICLQSYDE